jgi:hypothetical protein
MRQRTNLRRVFAVPAAIALFSVIGLVSALTGDGWRDVLSWLGLAAPVVAAAWAMTFRKS